MELLFIGGSELAIVFLIALLFFGADSIPSIAKTAGKAMKEFKKATSDIKKEFDEHTDGVKDQVNDVRKTLNEGGRAIEDEIRKTEKDLKDNLK
ncbi:twin-arginine translocase TatA/TatE family subunit [Halosquirtibacter laminarini]|uniref:Twin-arginine translocase TatA/TatE family subunit n=1 Tax=Halosquirtibacter laminarini TaxID=3374600 RepID=A0AC61NN32_9BACT|nr:twin-arginine translocase TatA/TatE family subunit [Prolixibacteraceae bacterium]